MHSNLTVLNPIFHSAFVSNPREGCTDVAQMQSMLMQEKADRVLLMHSDAIGITACIKELRVEPVTCRLIIQQLAGSVDETYTDGGGGL